MAAILTVPHFPGNPPLLSLGPQNVLLTSHTGLLVPAQGCWECPGFVVRVMGTKTSIPKGG